MIGDFLSLKKSAKVAKNVSEESRMIIFFLEVRFFSCGYFLLYEMSDIIKSLSLFGFSGFPSQMSSSLRK